MGNSTRFDGLDLARFLAAITVAMGHLLFVQSLISDWALGQTLLNPFRFGSLSVSFFFCLSGFVLSGQIVQIRLAPSLWMYARLVRLLPLYYFSYLIPMTAYIVLAQRNGGAIFPNGWQSALLGLTASQSWTPSYLDMPNPPLWSLSVEVWLSILLVIISIVSKSRGFIACIAFLSLLYSVYLPNLANAVTNSMHLFLFGVVLNHKTLLAFLNRSISRLIIATLIILFFVPIYRFVVSDYTPRFMNIVVVIFTSLVILFFAVLNVGESFRPLIRFLGARTYSLYAVHFPILIFFTNVESPLGDVNPLIYIFVMTTLIFFVAEFSYRFVEKPSLDLSRQIRGRENIY